MLRILIDAILFIPKLIINVVLLVPRMVYKVAINHKASVWGPP